MSRLVSIVVPVYNGMPHLPRLVDSLLAQDYPRLEIVFSDGGSTDGSLELLRSIDDARVRVEVPAEARGAAANWNAATRMASGDYIKLVCQDDLLRPDAISVQVADLEQNPSAVMAICQRDIVDANGSILYRRRGCAGLASGAVPGSDVIRACYTSGTNVLGEPVTILFRRDALLAGLPWDDSSPLVLDLRLYAKVAPRGDIVVRKESLGAFRVSTSSWSTRIAADQMRQFHQWQLEFAAANGAGPLERLRATVGLRVQTTLRRGAYQWLRLKGSFHSA